LIAAHLFVFYFGILRTDPPVCLAARRPASPGPNLSRPAESFKLDMRTFLLPYMFITAPQMLLIGLDPGIMGVLEASWIFITASIGMYALAAGMQGFFIDDEPGMSACCPVDALLLVWPGVYTDITGLAGFTFCVLSAREARRLKDSSPCEVRS
jgi:TRAP-type uncharacterized transport system fused permease subunit